MELRTLRYFMVVAQEGTMSRAAQVLHVSQPTLSRAIQGLEQDLGDDLFIRRPFSLKLTAAGHRLQQRARDLLQLADQIEDEFGSPDQVTGGELYLGLAESWQIRYLAQAIKQLKQTIPDLHYHVTSGDSDQIIDRINRGLLDFAVLAEVPDANLYDSIAFPESDRWGVIIPATDKLAQQEQITLDDLVDHPIFASEQAWNHEITTWAHGRINELSLEGTFRLPYNGSLFTQAGLGYLLTFEHLVDTSPASQLVFRPLSPTLTTTLYFVWKKDQPLTTIARRFRQQIVANFKA